MMTRVCESKCQNGSAFYFLILVVCLLSEILPANGQNTAGQAAVGTTLIQSLDFHGRLRGEQGFIIVPENRNDSASRMITAHYFRFPAREPTGRPPVFILPGGPGQAILTADIQNGMQQKRYNKFAEIEAYNRNRDVVIVNQRGNSRVPGIQHLPSTWTVKPGDWSKPMSFTNSSRRLAIGFKAHLKKHEALKFDLRGYDILHLVDDIDAIRRAYGYEKLALRGGSFGSQWALAYLKRYPTHVERMILSGTEPLDYGYDSAEGIWNVFIKIEEEARASKEVVLPEVGLLGAVKSIITRLEKQPVKVRGYHPRKGYPANVVIGADDFRYYLTRPILNSRSHSREMLELWPKFVLEIYQENYQYLASKIIDDRPEDAHYNLLLTLVDNSLGVTGHRQKKLESDPAYRWLGDPNWFYKATRDVTPTPVVNDEFRQLVVRQTPVLLIHGTLDLATPYENAEEMLQYFPKGHLITVKGGTHFATYHAASVDPRFLEYLSTFMDSSDPETAIKKIPSEILLPELQLKPNKGQSLFDELSQKRK
ncbi:MAG: alpha/beta hydrolase [Gimesia sp.]|nr:alpha/beta hydrolase [Gimesia sp.]